MLPDPQFDDAERRAAAAAWRATPRRAVLSVVAERAAPEDLAAEPRAVSAVAARPPIAPDGDAAPSSSRRSSASSRRMTLTIPLERLTAYAARPLRHVPAVLFIIALAALLVLGRRNGEEGHLTPENGLGYWLGIVGSLAMLALLLYPLRKRMGRARWLGSVAAWFRVHMMLGLIGPALILVHCNFKSGSLNATVALVAMLLVAGSGLVGRYFYGRVHMGLYGRKARVEELLADSEALTAALGQDLAQDSDFSDRLAAHHTRSMSASLPARLFLQRGRSRRLRRRLTREARGLIRAEAARAGWSRAEQRRRRADVAAHLGLYFAAVDKAAAFGVYDRLLAAWHIAHLPMFLLLVIAAIVHVIAVHLY